MMSQAYLQEQDFSISAGMSPTGVALDASRFKMVLYTKSSDTG